MSSSKIIHDNYVRMTYSHQKLKSETTVTGNEVVSSVTPASGKNSAHVCVDALLNTTSSCNQQQLSCSRQELLLVNQQQSLRHIGNNNNLRAL